MAEFEKKKGFANRFSFKINKASITDGWNHLQTINRVAWNFNWDSVDIVCKGLLATAENRNSECNIS